MSIAHGVALAYAGIATRGGNCASVMVGDCVESMRRLPDASVQCCVTSPPYFGLRDYGAVGQLGLEATPDAYVAGMVNVFREVRRVLRDDGILWLNLGDSYATGTKADRQPITGTLKHHTAQDIGRIGTPAGLKTKDLIGIPWRVAFALQADGWYLRQDIIWHKPNPMPESVTDRCTKAHEYVFMLTKSARYYFDADAIREPHKRLWTATNGGNMADVGHKKAGKVETKNTHPKGYPMPNILGANKRSVWTVTTKPYKGAHFATFPPDLIEPCVLASSRPDDTILDPFGGSGTVAGVALKHGRNAILCELNPEYVALMPARVEQICNRK